MSPLELTAAALGVLSVWLTVRQNEWCWPVGAVMVALYTFIFWRERLYADAGLQVFYFGMQFYGWYQWRHGGQADGPLRVHRTPPARLAALLAAGAVGTFVLGFLLSRYTNQDLAYWDSGVTAFSFVAQWMLAKKYLENWLVWIAVDVLATGVYFVKNLYPTAILYGIFIALAVAGYREWRRACFVS